MEPLHGHYEDFEHIRKSVAQQFKRYSYVGGSTSNEKGVVIFGVFTAHREFGTHLKFFLGVILPY